MVIERIPGDTEEDLQKDGDDEKRPWWEFWGGGRAQENRSALASQSRGGGGGGGGKRRGRRRRNRMAGFASLGVGEKVMNPSAQDVGVGEAEEANPPPRRKRTTGMEPSVVGVGEDEKEEDNWVQKRRERGSGGGSSSTSSALEGAAYTRRWIEGDDAKRREFWVTGQDSSSQIKTMVLKDTRAPLQRVVDGFLNRFFPLGYPNSVSEGYLVYSQYRAVQHFASAILSVLSTQSLLFAAGLRPTPAQATIASWVLKDGMQHIGKFICSSMGAQMDSEPKRWRIFADAMYDVGVGLEVISPMCPQHFLQVAGLANMAKGMALVSARATRLPIYTSFARESNLSDLYAKGEAISTLSNVLGLGVGIRLASTVCSSIQGKLLIAPWLSAIHIYCVTQEMRAAPINSLNSQRTALLVADFMKTGIVSRPAALRYRERLILPNVLNKEAGNVRVGAPLMRVVSRPSTLAELKQQFPDEKFLLRFADKGTDLVLHQSATGADAVRGWLVAAYAHKMACDHHDCAAGEKGFAFQKLESLKEAFEETEKVLPTFLQGLQENGWHTQLFQLGSGHRAVW